MFITKKGLSRRTILRGMGAGLALPLLDAMVPALTPIALSAANPTRRLGIVFTPLGWLNGHWVPSTTGPNFEYTTILKPLESLREHVTLVTGLNNPSDGHAISVSAWLSGALPKKTFAEDVYSGETVDQVVAKKIGQETALPSLELATEDFTGYIGGCDTQYACAYMNTISWSSATTPVPMEINPRVVFERLFGRPGTVDQRKRRMQRDKSILDSLTEDVSDLKRDLGGKDATRLAEYLDHVREVERRIQVAEKRSESSITADAPVGIPEQWEEHARLQYELMLLAYASDATRVITFMKAKDASMLSYLNLGIAEPHHGMTHNLQVEGNAANLVKINTFHVSLFAEFLERMKKTPDGDGSLLDHTMLLYGSGMSHAPDHSRLNLPTVLVGGSMYGLKGNRHLAAPKETPFADMLLTIANKFDCNLKSFGTLSKGEVEIA
jgi:hypothetical protein